MKNQKGIVDPFSLLAIVAIIGAILYIPNNPVGNALGVTQKQNKVVQADSTTQTLVPATADGETLYHKDGSVAMVSQTVYKRKDVDQQQSVTLWERFLGIGTLFQVLIVLALFGFPPALIAIRNLRSGSQAVISDLKDWKSHTHQIVLSVDAGLATLPDEESKKKFKIAMKGIQDQEVQRLVGILQTPALPQGI